MDEISNLRNHCIPEDLFLLLLKDNFPKPRSYGWTTLDNQMIVSRSVMMLKQRRCVDSRSVYICLSLAAFPWQLFAKSNGDVRVVGVLINWSTEARNNHKVLSCGRWRHNIPCRKCSHFWGIREQKLSWIFHLWLGSFFHHRQVWPYAAGCVRTYAMANEQTNEISVAVRSKQAQDFDFALSKLDSSVRRTGRITKSLLLSIFHNVCRTGELLQLQL